MMQLATINERKAMIQRLLYTDEKMNQYMNLSMSDPESLFVHHTSNKDLNYHMELRTKLSKLNTIDPEEYYREMRQKWVAWIKKYIQRLQDEVDYDELFERPAPGPEEVESPKKLQPSPKRS